MNMSTLSVAVWTKETRAKVDNAPFVCISYYNLGGKIPLHTIHLGPDVVTLDTPIKK